MLKEEIMVEKQSRRDEEDSPITERTVKINRVSKVVKGGRHLSFSAVVVVGVVPAAAHADAQLEPLPLRLPRRRRDHHPHLHRVAPVTSGTQPILRRAGLSSG